LRPSDLISGSDVSIIDENMQPYPSQNTQKIFLWLHAVPPTWFFLIKSSTATARKSILVSISSKYPLDFVKNVYAILSVMLSVHLISSILWTILCWDSNPEIGCWKLRLYDCNFLDVEFEINWKFHDEMMMMKWWNENRNKKWKSLNFLGLQKKSWPKVTHVWKYGRLKIKSTTIVSFMFLSEPNLLWKNLVETGRGGDTMSYLHT